MKYFKTAIAFKGVLRHRIQKFEFFHPHLNFGGRSGKKNHMLFLNPCKISFRMRGHSPY